MWNLEKWYRWTYLQSSNRDTDAENKCMDTKGGKQSGMNWEIGIDRSPALQADVLTSEPPGKPINTLLCTKWGFPGGSVVKNSPAMQETKETQVWSLGQEDPLEKGMAT